MSSRDISVIMCTCKRPDSLSETLRLLAEADHTHLDVEAVVVENGPEPVSRRVAETWAEAFPVRYVQEPRQGKEFALNCGISQEHLGDIVAFLDDDMSPEAGWWHGVKSICDRYPEHDFFTGRTHIIWPRDDIPGWAKVYAVQSWAHSVLDYGEHDHRFEADEWPSGNMFWIRRRVLEQGFRFDESLNPHYSIGVDAEFLLRLAEAGMTGVAGPDAVAGHRVQEGLLDVAHIRSRAIRMGRALARIRLDKPNTLRQARLLRDRPLTFRLATAANLVRGTASYLFAYTKPDHDARIVRQLVALLGMANNWEALGASRR